ncbi:MAG: hypothetical protein JXR97_16275, partial [Planctomycetes bacterium]|nr:hypothetical protein [Planctomycetota bacterium]
LADDCSFGVAPAISVASLWIQAQRDGKDWYGLVMVCGIIYAACAIIRLARYNVEIGTADKNYFTGLPSPAAAGAVVSTVLLCQENYVAHAVRPLWSALVKYCPQAQSETDAMQAYVIGVYMLVIGVLMISRWRFVHAANKYVGGRKKLTTFVAFLFLLGLLYSFPVEVLFVAFNGYVVFSLLGNMRRKPARGATSATGAHETHSEEEAED